MSYQADFKTLNAFEEHAYRRGECLIVGHTKGLD